MTLDERLAEVLDFAKPGYQRLTITPEGIHRHAAMTAMAARDVELLSDETANGIYARLAKGANRFARQNAAFIADLAIGGRIVFPARMDVELADGEFSLRVLQAGEHAEDGFHVHCIALHVEEMDAAMRHLAGDDWDDREEDEPDHELNQFD